MISTKPPQLVSAVWGVRNGVKGLIETLEAFSTVEEVEAVQAEIAAQNTEIAARKIEVDAAVTEGKK